MNHFHTLPLFSQPVGLYDLNVDPKKILKKIKKIPYQPILGSSDERRYGSKTAASVSYKVLKELPDLKDEIDNAILYHIREILRFDIGFHIFSSWATKTGPEGYALSHCHSNSWLSGCYYMQSHPSFEILFKSPLSPAWHMPFLKGPTDLNIYSSFSWSIPTLPGRLIIFPSLLQHEILTNYSKINRYSIAFNLIPKGALGNNDGSLILNPQ